MKNISWKVIAVDERQLGKFLWISWGKICDFKNEIDNLRWWEVKEIQALMSENEAKNLLTMKWKPGKKKKRKNI